MIDMPHEQRWPTEHATAQAGAALGPLLAPGDVVLLQGDVGAGKTHFARALIQSILVEMEDVPSPTFTLVQVYDTRNGPLWHADLYRISTPTEVDELGLTDAFEDSICIIEWPDRLGPLSPKDALRIEIATQAEGRMATFTWADPRWAKHIEDMSAHV